ncbi:COQ9 family protein [Hirschia maritima]|uniref:COQ9 family protein n=1 Tax=Hirschia maritima TaxID=1121961 RepID=UPI0003644D00|nr:COQ9 family protein [Hirschia maritima]
MNAEKSNESTQIPPSKRNLKKLLDTVIEDGAFDGWNDETLKTAAKNLNLSEGDLILAAPDGISTLLEEWANLADEHVAKTLQNTDLSNLKIRERITLGVRARIEFLSKQKESARRASHAIAAPWRVTLGPKLIWNAADTIWTALGDKSTDANWYSKRTVLSGVIGTTLSHWLASDEDIESTWDFLDKRIENVMQFEKTKAQVKQITDKLPDPLDILNYIPKAGPFKN